MTQRAQDKIAEECDALRAECEQFLAVIKELLDCSAIADQGGLWIEGSGEMSDKQTSESAPGLKSS